MPTFPPIRSLTALARGRCNAWAVPFFKLFFSRIRRWRASSTGLTLASFAEAFPPTILGFEEGAGILIQRSRVICFPPEIGHSQMLTLIRSLHAELKNAYGITHMVRELRARAPMRNGYRPGRLRVRLCCRWSRPWPRAQAVAWWHRRRGHGLDYELVVKPEDIQLFVRDHGKPADISKGSAKLTVLAGNQKQEINLLPDGDRFLAKGAFGITSGAKAVAHVNLGGPAVTVRFVLK